MNTKLLTVEVLGPEQLLYKGPAEAVTAINETGTFDILPYHSRFISMIKDTLTIRTPHGGLKQYHKVQGVIRCYDDLIQIYLGI